MSAPSTPEKRVNLDELQTVQRFKNDLVKAIPYVPNNKESKEFLLSLGVDMLLHMHDFWHHRLIDVRPRRVDLPSCIRSTRSYIRNREKVKSLVNLIETGQDVNGYLSRKAHYGALDLEAFKEDKDFMRSRDQMHICEGYHHLHLEPYPDRTDDLVIAKIFHSRVDIVGVFPHAIFEEDRPDSLTSEYELAVSAYAKKISPSGGHFIGGPGGGMQNLAGSSIQSTTFHTYTLKIIMLVEQYEGGLEAYVRKLYEKNNRTPKNIKPIWVLKGRSLEIHDKVNKTEFKGEDIKVNTHIGYLTPMKPDAFGWGFL
ncbi:hypothetical protein [Pseudomonas viridiflava]|uniref:hypothetical protein n=1 Tax=Pseudomonas viridiflava TaxID=33069 RepID=UPI000F032D39|nr:hypothetical protein [Pseudomonas viridiflava]MDY0938325.1 hypothetical protein [Pseudomonas viridiflava]MDY1015398.1 hypothetical protein [Pseudomonas viridiflava]